MPQRKFKITSPSGKEYVVDWTKDTDPSESDFKELQRQLQSQEEMSHVQAPPETQEPAGFMSRTKESLGNVVKSGAMAMYGLHNPEILLTNPELAWGALQPVKDLFNTETVKSKGIVPGVGENVARAVSGLIGLDYDTFDKDIQSGNYGAAIGDWVGPGAFGWLLRKAEAKTEPRPSTAPTPQVKKGPPPTLSEIRKAAAAQAAMKENLGAGPKLLGPGNPANIPESSIGPRFVAGPAGVADRTVPYIHDPSDVMKAGPRGIQGAILNPDESLRAQPTLSPEETPPLVDVGPFVAANRTPFGIYRDIAQQNPAFEALIPNRLRSEKDILGATGPDIVPGVTKEFGGARPIQRPTDMPITPWGREIGGLGGPQEIVSSGEYKGPRISREGLTPYRVYYGDTGEVIKSFATAAEADKFASTLQKTGANVDWAPDLDTAVEDLHKATKTGNELYSAVNNAISRPIETWDTLPKIEVPTKSGKGELYIHNDDNSLTPQQMDAIKSNPGIQNLGGKVLDITNRMQDILRDTTSPFFGKALEAIPKRTAKIGLSFNIPEAANKGINMIDRGGSKQTAILIDPSFFIANGTPRQSAFGIINSIAHELAHNIDRTEHIGHASIQGEILRLFANDFLTHFDELTNLLGDANGYRPEFSDFLSRISSEARAGGSPELSATRQEIRGTGQQNDISRESGIPRSSKESGDNALEQLSAALNDSIQARLMQDIAVSAEKKSRLGQALGIKEGGVSGYKKQMGKLKGEYPKAEPPEFNLSGQQFDELLNTVRDSPEIRGWEQIRAKTALYKMFTRTGVLQPNEIKLLRRSFGNVIGDQIDYLYGGLGGIMPEGINPVMEAGNFAKAVMAAVDLSAPFRQAIMTANRPEFWKAFKEMYDSFKSEDAFKTVMETIENHPKYEEAREAGVKFTKPADYSQREEMFHSKLAEKYPLVKNSERAYIAFLNKLRMDLYARLSKDSELALFDEGFNNPKLAEEIADYVNNATGRGTFKNQKIEAAMPVMNTMIFSPRLIKSRLEFFNPMNYLKTRDPFVRKQYLKSLLALGEVATITLVAGKALGGSIETDPRSSDYMKVKFGNTRVDPWGGFQQYVVAASRLVSGETKSSTTGSITELGKHYGSPTRLDVLGRFAESKSSPIVNFVTTMLRGKDMAGAPLNLRNEVIQRVTPMMTQDLYDIAKEDPNLLPLSLFGALGFGVQTYTPRRPDVMNWADVIK